MFNYSWIFIVVKCLHFIKFSLCWCLVIFDFNLLQKQNGSTSESVSFNLYYSIRALDNPVPFHRLIVVKRYQWFLLRHWIYCLKSSSVLPAQLSNANEYEKKTSVGSFKYLKTITVAHEREISSQIQFLTASTHGLLPSLTGQFPMVFYKTIGYSPFMCKQLYSSYVMLGWLSLV